MQHLNFVAYNDYSRQFIAQLPVRGSLTRNKAIAINSALKSTKHLWQLMQ